MDKKTVINKIRKCLALAASANEHEAAAALRQAQKLMELHRVSDSDMLAAGVGESKASAGAIKKPSNWEGALAAMIADAFACHLIFQNNWTAGKWVFVGVGANAEVADYAFSVLLRQVRKNRATFIKGECKRLIPTSKTRRADLFCLAWVRTAANKVHAFVGGDSDVAAINAYLLLHYPSLKKMEMRDRNEGRTLRVKDWDAVNAGSAAGRGVQLNRSVGGAASTMIGHES